MELRWSLGVALLRQLLEFDLSELCQQVVVHRGSLFLLVHILLRGAWVAQKLCLGLQQRLLRLMAVARDIEQPCLLLLCTVLNVKPLDCLLVVLVNIHLPPYLVLLLLAHKQVRRQPERAYDKYYRVQDGKEVQHDVAYLLLCISSCHSYPFWFS